MTTEQIWLVLLAGGAGTFLARYSFFWLSGKRKLSAKWAEILRFVPPAVMSALIVPGVVLPGLESGEGLLTPRVIAALIATGIAWITRGVIATFTVGMTSLWLLQYFMG